MCLGRIDKRLKPVTEGYVVMDMEDGQFYSRFGFIYQDYRPYRRGYWYKAKISDEGCGGFHVWHTLENARSYCSFSYCVIVKVQIKEPIQSGWQHVAGARPGPCTVARRRKLLEVIA